MKSSKMSKIKFSGVEDVLCLAVAAGSQRLCSMWGQFCHNHSWIIFILKCFWSWAFFSKRSPARIQLRWRRCSRLGPSARPRGAMKHVVHVAHHVLQVQLFYYSGQRVSLKVLLNVSSLWRYGLQPVDHKLGKFGCLLLPVHCLSRWGSFLQCQFRMIMELIVLVLVLVVNLKS